MVYQKYLTSAHLVVHVTAAAAAAAAAIILRLAIDYYYYYYLIFDSIIPMCSKWAH